MSQKDIHRRLKYGHHFSDKSARIGPSVEMTANPKDSRPFFSFGDYYTVCLLQGKSGNHMISRHQSHLMFGTGFPHSAFPRANEIKTCNVNCFPFHSQTNGGRLREASNAQVDIALIAPIILSVVRKVQFRLPKDASTH